MSIKMDMTLASIILKPENMIPFSFFDRWCSYLALSLSMMCRLQRRFQMISVLTLESKVEIKYV